MRTPFDESNESILERHSHFYHLSKLLREAVECFGAEAHRSERKVFYHSILLDKKIMNDSDIRSLFIYTPFSTTELMEVCLNCAADKEEKENDENNKLILELKGYVSKYFDCLWVSDFCYEHEKIFYGGTRALTVSKCIDFNYGYDYKLFISAMNYIPNMFKMNINDWKINKNDDMSHETKRMITNLIHRQLNIQTGNDKKYKNNFGENGIPKDIEDGLNVLCTSTTAVRIHYDAMYNHRAYAFLSSLFMTLTRTFANLDVFVELFPNMDEFSIIRVPLTSLLFFYLKSYLNNMMIKEDEEKSDCIKYKPKTIKNIKLIDPKTAAMSIDAVIVSERTSLAKMQWIIESPDQVSLVLRYSDEPIIIREIEKHADDDDNKDDEKDEKKEDKENEPGSAKQENKKENKAAEGASDKKAPPKKSAKKPAEKQQK